MSKTSTIYVRIPKALRDRIATEARLRGETASVIVRDALRAHFDPGKAQALHDAPPVYNVQEAKTKTFVKRG